MHGMKHDYVKCVIRGHVWQSTSVWWQTLHVLYLLNDYIALILPPQQ